MKNFLLIVLVIFSCKSDFQNFTEEDLINYTESVKMLNHYHIFSNPSSKFKASIIESEVIKFQSDDDANLEVLVILKIYPDNYDRGREPSMNYRIALFDFENKWVLKDSIKGQASDLYDDYTILDMNKDGQNEIVLETYLTGGGAGSARETLIISLENLRIKVLFQGYASQGDIKMYENNTKLVITESVQDIEDGGTYLPHKYSVSVLEYNGNEFAPKIKKTTNKKYCLVDCVNKYSLEKVLDELKIDLGE